MENSTDRSHELFNPQQLPKVDDKQNLFANPLVIDTVENISQSSGLGLNHTVQSVIDKWTGRQAIDLSTPINSSVIKSSSSKESGVIIVQPQIISQKLSFAPLATTITKLPVVLNKPADIAPTGLVINGVKSSYDVGSTLSIDPSFVVDGDGWKDVSKVDFWLTDSKGKRVELADVTSFVAKDPKDNNSAKFSYSTSLKGIVASDYKLNAVAYDKFGATSNQFTQAIGIKTVYQIGFDSSTNKVDASVLNVFTKLNGVQILGKATNNIHSIAGGKVQDFEKGSIFQSVAGTFSLQGTLNNFYKDLSAADKLRLGMPTANETSVGGYWHQSFQNGELQLVTGAPVKWSNQSLITDRFNLLGGATALGKSVGIIHDFKGSAVQDYERGSIFAYGNKTVAVVGSISTYYRANSGTLGLPTSEESTTSYGKRQDFQGAIVTSSTQFGIHTLHGSIVGYYTGLTAAQKDQLGAATTEEAVGGDGNWQQFFKGGSVLWKSNGTGEVKLTPFTVGFDGNGVNPVFTTEFNKVVGWEALGKATGNVHSVNGGTVQDFEKGSIFQSGAGTFAVRGSIGIYYRANSATLLLPTSAEIGTSYGWRQDFQGAVVTHSPQFGTHTLHGSVVGYYTGLTAAQKDQLGAATTEEAVGGDGNWQQFFKGGSVLWKKDGTGELKLTPFTVGSDGGGVNPAFTTEFNKVVGWEALGKATGNVHSVNGGTVQDFEKGSIFQSGAGTFAVRGSIGIYYRANSATLLLPTSAEIATSYGWRQDFQGAVVTHSPQFGTHTLHGSVVGYYSGLSAAQKDQLGAATTEEALGGDGNFQQFFKGGSVFWKKDGTGELKLSPFTVGFDGNSINTAFTTKFNEVVGWDYLGAPIGNITNVNGVLRQNFAKGFITQTGSVVEAKRNSLSVAEIESQLDSYWQANSALLGGKFDPSSSAAHAVKTDSGYEIFYKNGYLIWADGKITSNKAPSLDTRPPQPSPGGGTIVIDTRTPANNSGGLITITSNPQTPQLQPTQTYNKFQDNGININTEWWSTVFKWDANQGQPPADFYAGGYSSPNAIAELNLGSNTLNNGRSGISLDIGAGALKGYNDRLPSDYFAVRAYTQASFDGGQYTFQVRGDDGFQILAKNIVTNEWIYITPKDQWQTSYDSYKEITAALPSGRYDLHFHYFEGGGLARFDLSWGKGNSPQPIPSTPTTGGINYQQFTGVVRSDIGIKLRQQPNISSNVDGVLPNNQTVNFDAWTTGDSVFDPSRNAYDNRWFHVSGTNDWVSSAYINGDPDRSVVASDPGKSESSTTNNNATHNFNTSFFREGNIFWNGGYAPASTNPSSTNLGNAKGNCTWYVNGRLQELGYSAATLNKLSGNAQDWDNLASAAGITISSTPTVGSIAQWESGHVAVVEKVNTDGTITISESSYSPSSGSAADYLYKEETISASNPSRFIIVPLSSSSSVNNNPQINPSLPGTIPILPGTTPIISSSIFSVSETITSKERTSVITLISTNSKPIIYGDKPTWILIHGMENSSSDMDTIAQSIANNNSNVQILELDWKGFAKNYNAPVIDGASHIIDVATWAANKLHDLGISSKNINLVGHSLGALVSYEISKKMYADYRSKVGQIIALDPANLNVKSIVDQATLIGGALLPWASPIIGSVDAYATAAKKAFSDIDEVNFSNYSNYSKAYHSSIFGSTNMTKTAQDAFDIHFPDTLFPWDQHGQVKDFYVNELNDRANFNAEITKLT
jgi:surface antigen